MEKLEKKKLIITFVGFVCLFLLVLGKAVKLQIIDNEKLIAKSRDQFFRITKVYPKRGAIYDRSGRPLAINIRTYSIFTIPKTLEGDYSGLRKVAKIIPDLSYRELVRRVKSRNRYTWIARKVQLEDEDVEVIKKLKGIYIEPVPKRLYPNHELLSQTLGFVGVDNKGLAGIEYLFDKKLKGKPKIFKYIKDAKGRAVKFESKEPGDHSRNIFLSIDKDIQAYAEKLLKQAVNKYEADKGGLGVMDAETGEILAIANYPSFDPNEPQDSDPAFRRLSFISDPIEPGSTFKTFTVASALENKIATPKTSYFCERGKLLVQGHIISEAESRKKYEWLTVEEILKFSSNIGTTKLAFDLTFPKLSETLEKFGIGNKTGIEIPGESRGIYTKENNVSPIKLSNISFGQGVATTGIQMLAAYGAIANGGNYIKPTIVKDKKNEKVRIMSEETAQTLTELLIKAVEDGTGDHAKIPYFTIAGKTSTAQRPDSTGGYSGYVPGFIGFPVNVEKKFVVYVYVDNPKGNVYYGNSVAGPVFKKLTQYILYKNKDFDSLALDKKKNTGSEFDQVKVKHASTRLMGRGMVPNFVGLDKISAENMATSLDLGISSRGIGVVYKQEPAAGKKLEKGQTIKLYHKPPSYE